MKNEDIIEERKPFDEWYGKYWGWIKYIRSPAEWTRSFEVWIAAKDDERNKHEE